MTSIVDGGETADDIFSGILTGQRVPVFTPSELAALDYLRSVYQQITDFNHFNQVRFQATPFIQNMLSRMETWNRNRMDIYVSHDNNLFQILNVLNLTNWHCVNDLAVFTPPPT